MPHFDKNVELLQRRYHVFSDLSVVSSSAVGHCHGNITVEASKRRRHASQTPNDWMTRITHWERRRRHPATITRLPTWCLFWLIDVKSIVMGFFDFARARSKKRKVRLTVSGKIKSSCDWDCAEYQVILIEKSNIKGINAHAHEWASMQVRCQCNKFNVSNRQFDKSFVSFMMSLFAGWNFL